VHAFLTPEWTGDYRDVWNANARLREGLREFSATIKYFVEGAEHDAVELVVEHGEATGAGPAGRASYDFELWASPENWRRLATGDLGPRAAMLTKRLKFKGSMVVATRNMGGFEESLRTMAGVPTSWPTP